MIYLFSGAQRISLFIIEMIINLFVKYFMALTKYCVNKRIWFYFWELRVETEMWYSRNNALQLEQEVDYKILQPNYQK